MPFPLPGVQSGHRQLYGRREQPLPVPTPTALVRGVTLNALFPRNHGVKMVL